LHEDLVTVITPGEDNEEYMTAAVAVDDDWPAAAVRRGHGVCCIGRGLMVIYGTLPDSFSVPGACVVTPSGDKAKDLRILREAVKGDWFDHAAAARAKSKKNPHQPERTLSP
jgi:hypothetical protein